MSAKKAVLMVPTLGHTRTNMQLTDFHIPAGQNTTLGSGVECECEVVAQRVGTAILFRRIHSDDVKSDSAKYSLHTALNLSALYGTPRLSAHS